MRFHVQRRQSVNGSVPGRIDVAQRDQVVGKGPSLVAGPGMERGHERCVIDQAGLQGEQAEKEMAVRRHRSSPVDRGRGSAPPTIERGPVDDRINASIVC